MHPTPRYFEGFRIGATAIVERRESDRLVSTHVCEVVAINEATRRVSVYSHTFKKNKRRAYAIDSCNIAPADAARLI